MKLLVSIICVFGVMLTNLVSAEEVPSPQQLAENATSTRQAVFKLIYHNLAPLAGMARGKIDFSAELAERNSRRIATLAPMIPELFAKDTREFSVHTDALPIIWEKPDEFAANAQKLVEAATRYADTASSGDQRALAAAFRGLGGACGNCHDLFKLDDDD
ncbi:MAG: cytochrome c [Pseudomonadales bacterium]|nr:cytochrome c [Pseudomonadales bacterium]